MLVHRLVVHTERLEINCREVDVSQDRLRELRPLLQILLDGPVLQHHGNDLIRQQVTHLVEQRRTYAGLLFIL